MQIVFYLTSMFGRQNDREAFSRRGRLAHFLIVNRLVGVPIDGIFPVNGSCGTRTKAAPKNSAFFTGEAKKRPVEDMPLTRLEFRALDPFFSSRFCPLGG